MGTLIFNPIIHEQLYNLWFWCMNESWYMQNMLWARITDNKFYHRKSYWHQGEPVMGWAWAREVWAEMAQRADEKNTYYTYYWNANFKSTNILQRWFIAQLQSQECFRQYGKILLPYPRERGPATKYWPTPHFELSFLLRYQGLLKQAPICIGPGIRMRNYDLVGMVMIAKPCTVGILCWNAA